eukprot:6213902-Pleurochrysis_carterae.AAC.1
MEQSGTEGKTKPGNKGHTKHDVNKECLYENDARIERDRPFGFTSTEVTLIYQSTQRIESERIRMGYCRISCFCTKQELCIQSFQA